MTKQLFGETLIIVAGTLFFFGLAATVGIPGNERKAATAVRRRGPRADYFL